MSLHEDDNTDEMDDFTAVNIAEGIFPYEDEEELASAWQHLINSNLAWTLPGRFGRQAIALIKAGICHVKNGSNLD